jgi:uncharacterized protein YyaL (SSP411 family)
VVVCGKNDSADFLSLLRAVHSVYQPNKIVLGNQGNVEAFARTLLVNGEAAVFVCNGTTCLARTSDAAELKEMLA